METLMDSFDWAIEAYRAGRVFVAFDLETTGLDSRLDRIVEIGAQRFTREGPIDRYESLVDPGFPMPEAAFRVNGISSAMLEGQPSLEQVLPELVAFFSGAVLVAHNAAFDAGFINESLTRLYDDGYVRIPALPNLVADSLQLARRIFPARSRYRLQDLAKDLGVQALAAHRALDDARLCMEVFTACCNAAVL
jgi:DNA polymerase-3 subunit epsilon